MLGRTAEGDAEEVGRVRISEQQQKISRNRRSIRNTWSRSISRSKWFKGSRGSGLAVGE